MPEALSLSFQLTQASLAFPAGRAWQTSFAPYLPVTNDTPNTSCPAYAVLLELPADGILAEGGGLNFVLKRPGGSQPEWLQGTGNRDFEIAFSKVIP